MTKRCLILLGALLLAGCVSEGGGESSAGPEPTDLGGDDGGLRDGGAEATDLSSPCNPAQPGCPCEDGTSAGCYPGPAGTKNVGVCSGGWMRCEGGTFGECTLAVTPSAELCDGLDNDCDGTTDEELPDCVSCGPDCAILSLGPGSERPFSEGEALGGEVRITEEGELTLEAEQQVLNDVWIANTTEGTVSRLDATTGRELARYPSLLEQEGLRPWDETCDKLGGHGNCPSRTAVTLQGDVFVANRAFQGQGSVTKILGAGCPDRNTDGIVRTSEDANGDGRIDLSDPAEFPNQLDECLDFTVPVGGRHGVLRALAVDPFDPPDVGSVWVGAYEEQAVYRLRADNGEELTRLALPLHPYGALMDAGGKLWITSHGGVDDAIVAVDTATEQIGAPIQVYNPVTCSDHATKGGYGITIDSVGRIWVGGWVCEAALRYDPVNEEWFDVQLSGAGYTRGLAADAAGYIWAAHSHEAYNPHPLVARVSRFRAEDGGDLRTYELEEQAETIGVGLDSTGHVWAVSKTTDHASRIDPVSGTITHHPTGVGPYTYSDFTGYSLRTFISPSGLWIGQIEAPCNNDAQATWKTLRWDAQQPAGTRLQLYVRASNHPSTLADGYRFGPFDSSPANLEDAHLPHTRFVQVEVEMEAANRETAPRVRWIRFEAECPPEG